jgi:hypothetical protein
MAAIGPEAKDRSERAERTALVSFAGEIAQNKGVLAQAETSRKSQLKPWEFEPVRKLVQKTVSLEYARGIKQRQRLELEYTGPVYISPRTGKAYWIEAPASGAAA